MNTAATTPLRTVVGLVKVAAAAGIASLIVTAPHADAGTYHQHHTPDPTTALLAAHDCWTSNGPAGVIPGHAVYTLPGQAPVYGPADVGFAIWLDGKPGILAGFCR